MMVHPSWSNPILFFSFIIHFFHIFMLKAIHCIGYLLSCFGWSGWLFQANFLNCLQFEISHLYGVTLLGFTRYALHANTTPHVRIGCNNVERWIYVDQFHRISDPLDLALMHCWWNATVGMNPIPAEEYNIRTFAVDDEECSALLPIVKSTQTAPCAGDISPSKSVSIILDWTRSSSTNPSFLNVAYGMRYTVAPPSTSILVIGLPLTNPLRSNGFRCLRLF